MGGAWVLFRIYNENLHKWFSLNISVDISVDVTVKSINPTPLQYPTSE